MLDILKKALENAFLFGDPSNCEGIRKDFTRARWKLFHFLTIQQIEKNYLSRLWKICYQLIIQSKREDTLKIRKFNELCWLKKSEIRLKMLHYLKTQQNNIDNWNIGRKTQKDLWKRIEWNKVVMMSRI